jgi:hypothetical protein
MFRFNVNSRSGFQPRDARLKSTKIVNRASRGSRFYLFVELTLSLESFCMKALWTELDAKSLENKLRTSLEGCFNLSKLLL